MRRSFWSGVIEAVPICLVYAPVGLAFGVLASQAGLSLVSAGLMSILVYAGSAQFIAAGLLQAGIGFGPIILTTFLVNLRHALMSAALTNRLKGMSLGKQAVFCFELTDETFAIHSTAPDQEHDKFPHLLGVNLTSQICWVVATLLGVWLGKALPESLLNQWGVDYAMTAMFMALLALYLSNMRRVWLALAAIVLTVLSYRWFPSDWNPILITVMIATGGALTHREG
ncbi:MAG TPA: AzlC family ABC transporter permease [Bacillota bacterium]|nr:AzlC family ABC transporter permease [Bacillota bacterium]